MKLNSGNFSVTGNGCGFGVTYEGLKHKHRLPIFGNTACFGVTYEGLKQVFQSHKTFLDVGFGVTYEGLKLLRLPGNMDFELHVLELPMRV